MKFENVNILIQALENDDYIKVSEIDLNIISKTQVLHKMLIFPNTIQN